MRKNHLWKSFKRPNLETQVAEIKQELSQIKEENTGSSDLVIAKHQETENQKTNEEKQKTKRKQSKKTATDIHLQIKEILNDSPDLNGHTEAHSVLQQAFKDNFKGKRLTKWEVYLDEYFDSIENTEMASNSKSMWSHKENKHIGSDFDGFLKKEGIYEAVKKHSKKK